MKLFLFLLLFEAAASAVAYGSGAPVTIYYSFDAPPSTAAFSRLQAEVTKIFDPAEVVVRWREIDGAASEEAGELFVVRFHGTCLVPDSGGGREHGLTKDEHRLAGTNVSDGHVLPFADVWCDRVRRYARPESDASLGQALARVTAHEIYHMITASETHGGSGVTCAEYSQGNLTERRFVFGTRETAWLRLWAAGRLPDAAAGLKNAQ